MIDQHAPFLRAIVDDPSDTFARLVYADWLESHGDPRGEFIRVQCEIGCACPNYTGTCKGCTMLAKDPDKFHQLSGRLIDLWTPTNFTAWTPPCIKEMDSGGLVSPARFALHLAEHREKVFVFRKGFIREIQLTLADWQQHGPAIVAACPVEEVRLTDRRCFCHNLSPKDYSWYAEPNWDIRDAEDIPADFAAYSNLKIKHRCVNCRIVYDTKAEANADLSHMAIQWARDKAGMLKWEGNR